MTHKQLRKIAREIFSCEKIRQDESSTKEEKTRAENRIIQITNQLQYNVEDMLEIDGMVQDLLANKEI